MTAWLGVVSAEHVTRGVSLGIAQVHHGKRAGLARMRRGDWLIYYSPQRRLGGHEPVRAFTAIGRLPDEEVWQADEGDFRPWRRRVEYLRDARRLPINAVRDQLNLTASPTWGHQLRRGLLQLSDHDLAEIHQRMTGYPVPGCSSRARASSGHQPTDLHGPAGGLW